MGSHSRHNMINIQFKLVTVILFETAVYQLIFKFCFENSIYEDNHNFELVISKFMLKIFVTIKACILFHHIVKRMLFSASMLKSPRMITFSYRVL